MAKVMIINGVWTTIMCTMIAFGAVLYSAQASERYSNHSYAYDYTASDIE